jgi:hypothetical protein
MRLYQARLQLSATPSQWKLFIVDEESRKLIDNVAKEDDILNENVTGRRREAVYLRVG